MSIAYIAIEATKWVWNESSSTGHTRLVLLAIAAHCNADGWAWPRLETLEEASNSSRPTVIQAIDKLEELGEIEVERGGKGPGSVHRYYLKGFVERVKKGKKEAVKGKIEPDLRVNPAEATEHPQTESLQSVIRESTENFFSQNKNLEKERLEEVDLTLPLCKEERRALPKPVKEPKVRKGFQRTLPAKREYTPPLKPPYDWDWFAAAWYRRTDVTAIQSKAAWEAFEKLSTLSRIQIDSRMSKWLDQWGGRITNWAALDFLRDCPLMTEEGSGGDIPLIVNEE